MPRLLPRPARLSCLCLRRARRQVVRDGKHGSARCGSQFSLRAPSPVLVAEKATCIYLSLLGSTLWILVKESHRDILGEEMGTEH